MMGQSQLDSRYCPIPVRSYHIHSSNKELSTAAVIPEGKVSRNLHKPYGRLGLILTWKFLSKTHGNMNNPEFSKA